MLQNTFSSLSLKNQTFSMKQRFDDYTRQKQVFEKASKYFFEFAA